MNTVVEAKKKKEKRKIEDKRASTLLLVFILCRKYFFRIGGSSVSATANGISHLNFFASTSLVLLDDPRCATNRCSPRAILPARRFPLLRIETISSTDTRLDEMYSTSANRVADFLRQASQSRYRSPIPNIGLQIGICRFSSIPRYVIRRADFVDVCNFPKYPVYVIDRSKSEFVGVSSERGSSTRRNRRLEEIRCAEQAARQQRNVWSAKSCDLEEKPAPMQEVFLPSR